LGAGAVRLAWDQERQGAGCPGGSDADALRQRADAAGAGDQQGREQARAWADRGVGLAVAALAAGQCAQPVVPEAFWFREQAGAEGGDRGLGPQAADRVVALPGAWGAAGRGAGEGLAAAGGFDGTAARPGGGRVGVRRGTESRTAARSSEAGDVAAAGLGKGR